MLSAEQVAQFHRDGFVKGSRVLAEDEVRILQDEVLRVINARGDQSLPQPVLLHDMGKPDAPVWQIVNIYLASAPFKKLLTNATMAKEIAQLMEAREIRLWHDQIQYKPAATGGVNMWHQDSPYWSSLKPKEEQVTAWIALDDADADNGCMSMVPGSQRWGNTIADLHKLESFDAMYKEYRGQKVDVRLCPVRKGEVHFHHSLTWHGSGPNTSGRPRRAIALHFMSEKTVFVAAGTHPMKPYIHVADGAKIEGEAFPLVWQAKTKN